MFETKSGKKKKRKSRDLLGPVNEKYREEHQF
jgi:hypothetical protein